MNIVQVFLEAFRAMSMNRLRAGLTMLGIIIGVGAVVLMLAIGESVREDINRRIATMGSNVMIILPGSSTANGGRAFMKFSNASTRAAHGLFMPVKARQCLIYDYFSCNPRKI